MTEIPEHLLRRSKAAKADKSGEAPPPADGGGDSGASSATPAAASATPATRPAAAAPVEAAAPPPPKPDPPYVAAYKQRRRIPVWALPVVVFLPVWALFYAGTMQQPVVEDVLFEDAAAIYTGQGCSGCHGAGGGGGVGYQLSAGEVLATFPEAIDMMTFIARGTAGTGIGVQYGDPDRAGGAHIGGEQGLMPAFGDLTMLELELVVLHERAALSGEDTTSAEYLAWEERLREEIEAGASEPVDIELLLRCANPEYTPGATGTPGADDECPGPGAGGEGEAAAE